MIAKQKRKSPPASNNNNSASVAPGKDTTKRKRARSSASKLAGSQNQSHKMLAFEQQMRPKQQATAGAPVAATGSSSDPESVWIFGLMNNIEQLLTKFNAINQSSSQAKSHAGQSGTVTPSSSSSSSSSSCSSSQASSPAQPSQPAGGLMAASSLVCGPRRTSQQQTPTTAQIPRSSLSRQIKFHEYKGPPSCKRQPAAGSAVQSTSTISRSKTTSNHPAVASNRLEQQQQPLLHQQQASSLGAPKGQPISLQRETRNVINQGELVSARMNQHHLLHQQQQQQQQLRLVNSGGDDDFAQRNHQTQHNQLIMNNNNQPHHLGPTSMQSTQCGLRQLPGGHTKMVLQHMRPQSQPQQLRLLEQAAAGIDPPAQLPVHNQQPMQSGAFAYFDSRTIGGGAQQQQQQQHRAILAEGPIQDSSPSSLTTCKQPAQSFNNRQLDLRFTAGNHIKHEPASYEQLYTNLARHSNDAIDDHSYLPQGNIRGEGRGGCVESWTSLSSECQDNQGQEDDEEDSLAASALGSVSSSMLKSSTEEDNQSSEEGDSVDQIEPSIGQAFSQGLDELLFSEYIDSQDVPMNVDESDWLKKFLPPCSMN